MARTHDAGVAARYRQPLLLRVDVLELLHTGDVERDRGDVTIA